VGLDREDHTRLEYRGQDHIRIPELVSRESGRPIRFESPVAEQLARTESLIGYGRVDLEPSVALRIVLMTTNLDWTIKDGAVVVTEKLP
jgi:hypothetical protein